MRRVLAMIGAVLLASGSVRAADVPWNQQALLLLRTLAYDRNLKTRAGGKATVVILSRDGACDGLVSALEAAAKQLSVSGLPVKVVAARWPGAALESGIAAVYVCTGLSAEVAGISAITRRADILSISATGEDVTAGLGVGLLSKNGRAALVVNLAATREEGAELDSALLSVAEVIGR